MSTLTSPAASEIPVEKFYTKDTNYERKEIDVDDESELTGTNTMRRLRKAVITQFSKPTIDRLKMYVAVPVLKKLEEGQPLEYLSEMRQV